MTLQTRHMDAPRALLLFFGLHLLPTPYGPKPPKFARQVLREIRHAAARNGFKHWDLLETLSVAEWAPMERRISLAVECLDAAGPWVIYRSVRAAPGLTVREPVAGQRGSEVLMSISAAMPEVH